MDHTTTAIQIIEPQVLEGEQGSMNTETLADAIATLAAHLDAATYRLLSLIHDFDQREGWAAGGFCSCAHWLSFRIGLDLVTAREKVRVARALVALPLISDAFRLGQISYSKVRAITRIATPKNEADLLALAQAGTASNVEQVVRAYRRATAAEELTQAQGQREARYLQTYFDDQGMLVIRGRLPAAEGACVLKALEAAEAMLQADASAESPPARSLPNNADASAESLSVDPAGCHADASAESPPASPLPNNADASAPSVLTPLPLPAAGGRMADALVYVAEAALTGGLQRPSRQGPYQLVVHVDAAVLADPAAEGRSALEHGPSLCSETVRRLGCDASIVSLIHSEDGAILNAGRKTRTISTPLWRALLSRERQCTFPGCTRMHDLKAHHIRHWANGGPTNLENLTLLCSAHHWAVHEGGFGLRGTAPHRLNFYGPDGKPLPEVVQPPLVQGDPVAEIEHQHRQLGLSIDCQSNQVSWLGEPLDLDWAVGGLMS